jgi:ATP-dependent Clp protease ATP-binding subunit ClpE
MSEEDLNNMTNQFNSLLGNMGAAENLTDEESENESGFVGGLGNLFGFNRTKKVKNENEEQDEEEKDSSTNKGKKVRKTKYLDTFGENLTRKAREGKIDKVIGREVELQRTIQILNRRNKNNPALIGEPGVGKTAIVNALAIAIAEGNVPPKLADKEVYMIDMTSLVAGTQFRGQFEARIKGIIDECKSFGNIILAIDEVHNIVGGLEHDNSMNAANMLKPSLANGTVQLIGATTLKEYRQYIEKDTALERRFQPVLVEEPNKADCLEILKGIKKYYEDYHKVILTDEILSEAVNLSDRYIHDRFLPDKAIDLIDEACSRVNLDDVNLAKIEKLKKELYNIQEEKKELETKLETSDNDNANKSDDEISNFEKAAKLKAESCRIETEIESLSKKTKPKKVEFDDIAKVVELWTKIPVMRIKTAETTKLLKLKDSLKKKIIGQDTAVEAISNAILRKRSNIRNIVRPPSSSI